MKITKDLFLKFILSEKLFLFLLYLLVFFLPFKMIICNTIIIVLLFVVLLHSFISKRPLTVKNKSIFKVAFLLYFIQIFGLIYSNDIREGGFIIEKRLSLFIFPLIFLLRPILYRELKKIVDIFIWGLIACTWYSIVFSLYKNYELNHLISLHRPFFTSELMDSLGINHLTYGLFVSFAVSYIVYSIATSGIKLNSYYIFAFSTFGLGLLLMFPKMAILSIILSFVYIGFTIKINFSRKNIIYFVLLSTMLIGFGLSLPDTKERIRQFTYGYSRENIVNDPLNYSAMRAGAFYCSIDLIEKNWLFGLGTGGVNKKMNEWYTQHHVENLKGLDTHNQYFDFILSYGIIGFLLFGISLAQPLLLSQKEKFWEYSLFLILIIFSFLTENYLNSNKGIVFISFFNSLFAGILQREKYVIGKK